MRLHFRLSVGFLALVVLSGPSAQDDQLDWSRFQVRVSDRSRSESGARRGIVCKQHSGCPDYNFCRSGNSQTCEKCEQCRFQSDSVDGRCPQDRCPGTPTALRDNSAPTISWVFSHPKEVTVAHGEEATVHLYFYTKDTGSGFESAEIYLTSSTLSGVVNTLRTRANIRHHLQPGGTELAGTIRASFWFTDYDEGGLWSVRAIFLQDGEKNVRVYDSEDFLLMGADANTTIKVHTDANNYVQCGEASNIRCSERNAVCVDAQDSNAPYGTCVCQSDYIGDLFACLPSDEVRDFLASGEAPAGRVILAQDQYDAEIDEMASDDGREGDRLESQDAAGGEALADEASDEDSARWPGGSRPAPDVNQNIPLIDISDGRLATSAVMFTLLLLVCLQGCRRYRILMKFAAEQRRLARNRIHDEGDEYDTRPRVGRRRASHDGFSEDEGSDGVDYGSEARPRRSLMWLHDHARMREEAGGARDVEEGGRHGRSAAARRRARELLDQIEALDRFARMQRDEQEIRAPQPPPPVALPEHLRRPALPGEVKEEVPEGLECCICMEQIRCTRLEPCGHTDLCHGCAQHLFSVGAKCPMCRGAITAVIRT